MTIKQLWIIINYIFYVSYLYGITGIYEFENLNPEKKICTLLEEYKGNELFDIQLNFARKATRITDEADETLPYFFSLLRKYDAHPYAFKNNEIEMLNQIIILKFFQVNTLKRSDLGEF